MSVRDDTPQASDQPGPIPTGLKRVVVASMAGTVVEWYEFFLYATAATLVFNKVFFAQGVSESNALIAALLTYAVGFVARPLGGVVFGHFGDKFGRKKLLQFAILLVGVVTFLMGCLPTYAQIGIWAPLLLVILRFMQGFAVGGEWGGAVLLVAEHSPNRQRAFWASWPQAAVPVGNMLATVVLLVLTGTLSDAAFLSWGWRIAFWLSAVVVLIGYYIRTKVSDAPIFLEAQQEIERVKAVSYGVVEVLKRYPRGVFTAMGLRFAENIMYYLVVTFSIVYLKNEVGADTSDILWWHVGRARGALCGHPAGRPAVRPLRPASRLHRRCDRRGHVGLLRVPNDEQRQLLAHHGCDHHRVDHPRDHVRAAAGDHGRDVPDPDAVFRCVPWLSGDIDRRRVTGTGHRYLAARRFDSSVPIALYLAAAAVITLIAVLATRETKGIDLADVDQADRDDLAKAGLA